jgi:hypothetical protein
MRQRVEILWFDGCPNHLSARALIDDVVRSGYPDAEIESRCISNDGEARSVRFPGSPTIRVNGADIEPGFEDPGEYSLSCRVYLTSGGLRGVPPRQWLEAALDSAGGVRSRTS